jgi:replicative DNA helicase
MMSDLLKLVKQFPIWLGVISHLRKTGAGGKSFEEGHMASLDDIKGSGSIKQVSFDIIAFARNMIAEDERTKNTIRFRVLKARYSGNTGEAGSSFFNKTTRRLEAISATAVSSVESLFKAADAVSIDKMKERMGL